MNPEQIAELTSDCRSVATLQNYEEIAPAFVMLACRWAGAGTLTTRLNEMINDLGLDVASR